MEGLGVKVVVFNATLNNISWQSALLMGKTRVNGENHRLVATPWQTLSHNDVSSTHRCERVHGRLFITG